MNALWNALPTPVLLLDTDAQLADLNPAAETFLNLSATSAHGAALWDKVTMVPPLDTAFRRVAADQSSLFVDDVAVGTVGRTPVPCSVQIAPIGDDGQMILTLQPDDMAARGKPASQSSRAAKSAIGMAEMLAHEIKNPLAGITGAAQLLSMSLSANDRELTDLIVAETRRIVKLLEQVEQFGNQQPPKLQPVNLHDVLDRARQSASVGFGAHMMMVQAYDPSLPPTYADPDQLLQVLLNLLKNASEAGKAGGSITLHTFYDSALRSADGARLPLQIEVIDDGPGFPPDIAAHVFEPFISGRENGTGLGLALVSKLIADMGGMITVASAPGRTAFRLSLPIAPKDHQGDH